MKGYSHRISRRTKLRKVWRSVFLGVLVIIFLGILSFFIFSPTFRLKNVEVVGVQGISSADIENAVLELTSGYKYLIFPHSNIFLLSTKDLENKLSAEFTSISSVDLSRISLNALKVDIVEKESKFLWCREEECFYVDQNGFIFDYATDHNTRIQEGFIVFRTSLEGGFIGQPVAEKSVTENFLKTIKVLDSNGVKISEVNFVLQDKYVVATSIGDIILSPHEEDLEDVLNNVMLLYSNQRQKNGDNTKFLYIDARFGNKLFFKLQN